MFIEIRDYVQEFPGQTPADARPALAAAVQELKRRRRAIILAHNYQLPETQDVADFLGDSLELSRKAAATDAEVIVFCGVHFMAETAKILSPERLVLLPDINAGCPMADMITPDLLRRFRAPYPGLPVVAYVNTSAEVKAEVDICCTSANAVKVINSLDADRLLFIPDRYLAHYVQRHTDKEIIGYRGFCPTHALFTADMVLEAKAAHPEAVAICHPECPPEVVDVADIVASTSGMVKAAAERSESEFILATEWGLGYRLAKENPGKRFYVFPEAACPNMKRITLEKIVASLADNVSEIQLPSDVLVRARQAVERMIAIA
ncbi:MAG: quinolinate synthase NadA [Armatimonadetes bacterium]|nr:quinolinate synthase NadA [Armatimonadota bacterium]